MWRPNQKTKNKTPTKPKTNLADVAAELEQRAVEAVGRELFEKGADLAVVDDRVGDAAAQRDLAHGGHLQRLVCACVRARDRAAVRA